MNSNRLIWLLGAVVVVLLAVGLGTHLWMDHSRRNSIRQRYGAVKLPAALTQSQRSAGCDGLDDNACWTYTYGSSEPWAQVSTSLQTSLKQAGFIVYTNPADPDTGFIAQGSTQNLELSIAPFENDVDITVQDLVP